jgi:hypothetical protein
MTILPPGYSSTLNSILVEDFPPGYPQFSALISSHSTFQVYRRFVRLRSRLLLYKQDSLAHLEDELDLIDRQENRVIFLGNRRRDRNDERIQVMKKIDQELAEYGMLTLSRGSSDLSIEQSRTSTD